MAEATQTHLFVHPALVRLWHWINVLAMTLMIMSGWRIYNASPVFPPFRFPDMLTLGGWLGGALQWHFAGMWLLAFNGLAYLTLNLASGRLWRKLFPLTIETVWRDLRAALRGRLTHADPRHYNGLQRAAYLFAIADLVLMVLSGLALWKSVQFPLLTQAMGGYEGVRRVHFFAMTALVAFVAGHVTMVALVPRTLISMIRGH